MVSVLPRASPRAAAFGRKSNFAMAASTACLRRWLTLTLPLMIRDTVLAETPASRATILSVADWRGRGPLLPGVGAGGNFDFISPSAVCAVIKSRFHRYPLRPHSGGKSRLGLCENPFQFLERLTLGLGRQHHDEQEAGGGEQSKGEKRARGAPNCELQGKHQRDAGADQGVPKSNDGNRRGPLFIRENFGQQHPHHGAQGNREGGNVGDDGNQ